MSKFATTSDTSDYSVQEKWQKENMATVKARFKNEFVQDFKDACKALGVSQSYAIRKAMEDTIMNATLKTINDLLINPTKENVSSFIENHDGKVFALREFETTKKDIAKSRYEYKHCEYSVSEKDLLNDIINNPMQDTLYINSNDVWDCLDDCGENGYTIRENDLWYELKEWKNGENIKDVYIFK